MTMNEEDIQFPHISDKSLHILSVACQYIEEDVLNRAPTFHQMVALTGIPMSTIFEHVDTLREKGYMTPSHGGGPSITIATLGWEAYHRANGSTGNIRKKAETKVKPARRNLARK